MYENKALSQVKGIVTPIKISTLYHRISSGNLKHEPPPATPPLPQKKQ